MRVLNAIVSPRQLPYHTLTNVQFFALLAAITPHLFSRVSLFVSMHKNRPSALQRRQLPYKWEVKLADKVKNCEHFVLDEDSGYAILSCDFSRNTWNAAMVSS